MLSESLATEKILNPKPCWVHVNTDATFNVGHLYFEMMCMSFPFDVSLQSLVTRLQDLCQLVLSQHNVLELALIL